VAEAEVHVTEVKAFRTKSGKTRYVLVDSDGNEYSTFKEPIAAKLADVEGKRVRIQFHEQARGGFTNVYLDGVEPLADEEEDREHDVDEVASKTAIDAAPYLLSSEAVEQEVPAEELFEKLHAFKELVADDIERGDDDAEARAGEAD